MTEPNITCPACKTEIKLAESLAAPLIESIRRQYEAQLAQKESEVSKREAAIKEQQASIAKAQESIDEQVNAKIKNGARKYCRRGGKEGPRSLMPGRNRCRCRSHDI